MSQVALPYNCWRTKRVRGRRAPTEKRKEPAEVKREDGLERKRDEGG
jgi:hypothetical protein